MTAAPRRSEAESFEVNIPEDDLAELRSRLERTRWADDFSNHTWRYGVERSWLADMVRYWIDVYDWRAQEALINAYPAYLVHIAGMPVHFLHVQGKGPNPLPLVVTHGWPWTFWDMKHIIGPLSDPSAWGGNADDAFDVVVPSLPGFGFSSPLRRDGVDVAVIADAWAELMTEVLGYERFGAYGGDWGAMVSAQLGHAHPEVMVGVELSMAVIPGVSRRDVHPEHWAPEEEWMLARMAEAEPAIRSHLAVHVCDPQTLAYALADSPVGTAAWLWERRRAWSDCGGDPLSVFSREDLITNAAIYWLTGTTTTSMRLYAEQMTRPWPLKPGLAPGIAAPTGFAIFPKDLVFLPRQVAETHCDLRRWTVMAKGGHFAPAEQPAMLVEEIRSFFRPMRTGQVQ
ncbi:MAG: epoxide hydrolase family protein [Acidimicrobiales bacterium]